MLQPELDRYYTPPAVARRVVESCEAIGIAKCLDTTCGEGSLLSAARDILPDVVCVGMELDRSTIERLRRREPDWILSRADALSPSSWRNAAAGKHAIGSDLAVLNPPFTMATRKGISVSLSEFSGRCSVAMAHILAALTRAEPVTCVAIVPESLMFSELDADARRHLAERYRIRTMFGLRNSTFRGTRANALVVRFVLREQKPRVFPVRTPGSLATVTLVRGGLPQFEAVKDKRGLRYLHSTDLMHLVEGGSLEVLPRVSSIDRGVVSGHVLLLPRVGVPLKSGLKVVHLPRRVQLSDCVLALRFGSERKARQWEEAVRRRWPKLLSLYRGTGARYTTVGRLRGWLQVVEATLRSK